MLDDVGFAGAILARQTDDGLMIIDGHLRAEMDPNAEVPVLVLDVTEEEADKLLATTDPIAAMAIADGEALRALLATTEIADKELVKFLATVAGKGVQAEPAVPVEPSEARAQPGDLWLLGRHRVLCGDSCNPADVERLLAGEKPALCVTDPPYGVNYDPAWRALEAAKGNLNWTPRRVGDVQNDDRSDWAEAFALIPSTVMYCWHSGLFASVVQIGMEAAGFEMRAQIIWSKARLAVSRGHYHWRHEPCWYAVKKGAKANWIGDRKQTTVWDGIDRDEIEGVGGTQKPLECMIRPIRNHAGDVYEPFLGSGTTLIAAEMEDRTCYGMEIMPSQVDVTLARWEAHSGKTAVKDSGKE
jgi:DNA modification methylase